MNAYIVYVDPSAWGEMKRLPGHMRQRVRHAVDDLIVNPRPGTSELLQTSRPTPEARRIRLDRWRIIYTIDEVARVIDILAVRKRPPYDYGDLESLLNPAS